MDKVQQFLIQASNDLQNHRQLRNRIRSDEMILGLSFQNSGSNFSHYPCCWLRWAFKTRPYLAHPNSYHKSALNRWRDWRHLQAFWTVGKLIVKRKWTPGLLGKPCISCHHYNNGPLWLHQALMRLYSYQNCSTGQDLRPMSISLLIVPPRK